MDVAYSIEHVTSNIFVYIAFIIIQILLIGREKLLRAIWRILRATSRSIRYYILITLRARTYRRIAKVIPNFNKVKPVTFLDATHDYESAPPALSLDDDSERRVRFLIIALKRYSHISDIMVQLSNMPIELLTTMVIFREVTNVTGVQFFYVYYYGKRIKLNQRLVDGDKPLPDKSQLTSVIFTD